ncbi:MAG: hypothetical protein ACE5E8_05360 [Acidimicrobiia bacterium]
MAETRHLESGLPVVEVALQPGKPVALLGSGLTRFGLWLLREAAASGTVGYLDVGGRLCPAAAWEVGLEPARLVIVRCEDPRRWAQVAAALVEGLGAVCLTVPTGVPDQLLRRLTALARSRRRLVALLARRRELPAGVAHLRLRVRAEVWEGTDGGHGHLQRRRLILEISGKATGGMSRIIEVEDDGADTMSVVPGLAAAPERRAVG